MPHSFFFFILHVYSFYLNLFFSAQLQISIMLFVELDSSDACVWLFLTCVIQTFPVTSERRKFQKSKFIEKR